MEDTKTLVAGAASSQEQLAVAAQNAVTTIVQLSDVVKNGATSLGSQNQEAQVDIYCPCSIPLLTSNVYIDPFLVS